MGEKIARVGIEKDTKNYLYYVDKDGDISRAKLLRGSESKHKKNVNP